MLGILNQLGLSFYAVVFVLGSTYMRAGFLKNSYQKFTWLGLVRFIIVSYFEIIHFVSFQKADMKMSETLSFMAVTKFRVKNRDFVCTIQFKNWLV